MLDILRALGHYQGKLDVALTAPAARAAVKDFQRTMGLTVDGVIGKKETGPALERFRKALTNVDARRAGFAFAVSQCRVWRFTYYYIAEETRTVVMPTVPVYSRAGKKLFDVSPRFFAAASLEGSGRIPAGLGGAAATLINVDEVIAPPKGPAEYAPVLAIARANGWVPAKPGYAGLKLKAETVVGVRSFRVVTDIREGYGSVQNRAHIPLRTVAADVGAFGTSDPMYRGRGGVIPRGTLCWVPDLVGRDIPCEAETQRYSAGPWTHDGVLLEVDSGGGIDGNQCDLFLGTKAIANQFHVPSRMHLWYPGIEDRLPFGYTFGS